MIFGERYSQTTLRLLVSLLGAAALFALSAAPARADWVTVSQPLRAGQVLETGHLILQQGPAPAGAVSDPTMLIGMETRISLYPGRPVRGVDVGPPTLVRRNDVVLMTYKIGGLMLQTEGRALGGGGLGERIRVMNLDSRRTVWGAVAGTRLVKVQ